VAEGACGYEVRRADSVQCRIELIDREGEATAHVLLSRLLRLVREPSPQLAFFEPKTGFTTQKKNIL
jgi:hypothetical protein